MSTALKKIGVFFKIATFVNGEFKKIDKDQKVDYILNKLDELSSENAKIRELEARQEEVLVGYTRYKKALAEAEEENEKAMLKNNVLLEDDSLPLVVAEIEADDYIEKIKKKLNPLEIEKEELEQEIYQRKADLAKESAILEKFAKDSDIANELVKERGYVDITETGIAYHYKPFEEAAKDFVNLLLDVKKHLERPKADPDERLKIKVYEDSDRYESIINLKGVKYVVSIDSRKKIAEIGIVKELQEGKTTVKLIGSGTSLENINWVSDKFNNNLIKHLYDRLVLCRRLSCTREKRFNQIKLLGEIHDRDELFFNKEIQMEV
jgi:hypothetical protein